MAELSVASTTPERERLASLSFAPRISVAMCTYNGERYLAEQLESIARQQLAVFELIVCDDGSSDRTLDILENFARQAPFAVTISRNKQNLGSSKNFEQAMHMCSGDYIALSDQDDLWFPNKTAALVAALQNSGPIGGVFSDALLIDQHSSKTGSTLWKKYGFSLDERNRARSGDLISVLVRRPIITGATFMFRRDLLQDIPPIPDGWVHDEWLSWHIALRSRIAFTDDQIMAYRTHTSQQIGVPQSRLARLGNAWRTLRHGCSSSTKERVRHEYLHGARELGKLAEEESRRFTPSRDSRNLIQTKSTFCASVLRSFERSRPQRIWFALRNVSNYRRFRYLPLYALVRDLFV